MKIAIWIAAALLLAVPAGLFLLSSDTKLTVEPKPAAIGIETPVIARVENAHGVREVSAAIEQDGKRYPVFEEKRPGHRVFFFGKNAARDVTMLVGKKQAAAIHDGKAKLTIEARGDDFRGATARARFDVDVITSPPHVSADGEEHLINQGGSELVLFTPSGYVTESGVEVGDGKYRSFPLPSQPDRMRFSLFAYPWNMPVKTSPRVYVSNPAGAVAYAGFRTIIKPKAFRKRDIAIDDKFLEKVVNQIEPNGQGDLVTRFLRINGELRKKNNQTLRDLRLKSEPKVLWSGAFLPMVNSAVESYFADKRSYIYKGKKIDEQVHLGFDLAKVVNTAIPAANDGRVIWASDLGIYGNCIVIDHGYGLQSIYGHLSQFEVKPGDAVKRGQEIGKSGSTGLAGGDHLHFSMQVDGVQINPVEWWDAHWIHDRILSKLK